jgi:hypothetical protein
VIFRFTGPNIELVDYLDVEIAAPEPDRIFPPPESLSDPAARPARHCQQYSTGTIGLAAIAKTSQYRLRRLLFLGR